MKNQLENKYIRLTSCERLIMEVLWASSHDMSLFEIMDITERKYNRIWKRQTIATFLSHISIKGLVSSYRIGRVFYYKAEIPKNDYIRQEAPKIIRDYYSNNVIEFLSAVNESRGFTEDEKNDILRIIRNS